MVYRLIVTAAIIALVVLLVWAIVRAGVASGRAAAATTPRPGEQAAWSAQPESQGPVIDVTATRPEAELAEMIRENNRLLREILEELRRRPEPPPSAPSDHLG